jgi:hypothetical protein
MKPQPSLNSLVPLLALLALVVAAAGLFWQAGGASFAFTTFRGQTVQIYGQDLYRNDTVFYAAGFKGADAVTLFVTLPLLAVAFRLYRRGSLHGALLLAGSLGILLYYGASMTFSAAFNSLFFVYAAIFSAGMFSLCIVLTTIDVQALASRISPGLPHRGLAVFMFVAGLGTFALWLSELVGPVVSGQAPNGLGPYTTMFTHGFDSAVITPAAALTGVCLLRRKPLGYLLAPPILVMCIVNGVTVIAATLSQTMAGIIFPIGVYVGMVGSWVLMGAFAVWLLVAFFRNLSAAEPAPSATLQAAHA